MTASTDGSVSTSPVATSFSPRPRSGTRQSSSDVASLTSFNPFAEEDEHDHSSYTLVTSLFSKVKNTLSGGTSTASNSFVSAGRNASTSSLSSTSPLPTSSGTLPYTTASSSTSAQIQPTSASSNVINGAIQNTERKASVSQQTHPSSHGRSSASVDRKSMPPRPTLQPANPAPPLVSLTPAQPEVLTYIPEPLDRSPSRSGVFYVDSPDGTAMGSAIPGFPIQDDARSIKTATSLHRSGSVSKHMRRLRGEGLSRDYWMDDETCKDCYDCKSMFTTWRRKHHCRICGQIFCSRCASNIIKGSRFGSEGMVRVCNLCLEKLAKGDHDDEDDRRSVISSSTSFPSHPFSLPSFFPTSPFPSSFLGKSGDDQNNLYSIAETSRRQGSFAEEGFSSRPITPHFQLSERDDGVWESMDHLAAPFRRTMSEDDRDAVEYPDTFGNEQSPTAAGSKTPVDFPVTVPVNTNGTSSIAFPKGSPEKWDDAPLPGSRMGSRFNSYEVATPFIRSRVQSRLDTPIADPGWRTRRESTAYAQELNLMSMLHLKTMLRQMLMSEHIPSIKAWEDTLLRLALRIARDLTFTSHQQGEEMDVRRYVKIKKIPGGVPSDSEFVDGVVITKNVAHKRMSRSQRNPRIMLITFPLEFARVEGQYLNFSQIVRQEKEYLGNLASRIAALRPHVLLVEKSVSGFALGALATHNISVARAVKPSAIQKIAQMTQADVFSSIDKLAAEPRLGHCAKYRIQSFDHPLIPGRRKTYMRFEGCNRELGCTLVLRGGDVEILRKVKKVTRFLTFMVRNLKLETHLWKDSLITLPPFNPEAAPPLPDDSKQNSESQPRNSTLNLSVNTLLAAAPSLTTPRLDTPYAPSAIDASPSRQTDHDDDLPSDDLLQLKLSRRINQVLQPYRTTFISVSATLRFLPPYPLRRMKELDDELQSAKRQWEDEVVRREEKLQASHAQEATLTQGTISSVGQPLAPAIDHTADSSSVDDNEQRNISAQIDALPSLSLDDPPFAVLSPLSSAEAGGYFSPQHSTAISSPKGSSSFSSLQSASRGSSFVEPVPEPLRTSADVALESRYTFLKWQHGEFRRIWEWYLRKNQDDFIVDKYQCISFMEYTIPASDVGRHRPCFAPTLKYTTFYGENDCTLGQFIEKTVTNTVSQFLNPKALCTGKGCDKPLARHSRVYVHNGSRLLVATEQWDGQVTSRSGYYPQTPDSIMTWSICRVCGAATPFIPISAEMQRYSFAKFIELLFYPTDVQLVHGAGCQHNIYEHHTRYFAMRSITVRFQTDPVTLFEVVYPPFRIRVRPEAQLELRNKDFERLHYRNLAWYTALIDDLKLISIEAATGDEQSDGKLITDINNLISRAEDERDLISRLINRLYRESAPTDTLALTQVHAVRQDKIVAWQADFDRLSKPRSSPMLPAENLRKSSAAFSSVRAIWPRRYELSASLDASDVASSSVSEVDEAPIVKQRRGMTTTDSLPSYASDVSEAELSPHPSRGDSSESSSEPKVEGEKARSSTPAHAPTESSNAVQSEAHHRDGSNSDSDSTIGAPDGMRPASPKPDVVSNPPVHTETDKAVDDKASAELEVVPRLSRLPRRANQNPSVADLIKRYQDYLPIGGVHDLARTALTPGVISESEQEYQSPPVFRPTRHRSKRLAKKPAASDFESSYAANIAPRYLTHVRRPRPQTPKSSKIPGPVSAAIDAQSSSRRASPEKKLSNRRTRDSRPPSPSQNKGDQPPGKPFRPRVGKAREKPRLPSGSISKAPFRRPSVNTPGKVSNMTRHFEKLGRESRRSDSLYSVIRGRRARPVASAKARVEVLDSVKDALDADADSDSSSSSSQADDEGEDDVEIPLIKTSHPPSPTVANEVTEQAPQQPSPAPAEAPLLPKVYDPPSLDPHNREPPPDHLSLPPSPFLSALRGTLPVPSELDVTGAGVERHSLLKAISGLWLQPTPALRQSGDIDDPFNDPEHIFRDSSMIVRTDEPTSIIALALNSPQYREMLIKSRAEKRSARATESAGEVFMPDDRSVAETASTWGVVDIEASDGTDPTEDLRLPSSKLPWAISFESGGLTISCTVLYPEQFDALRRTYDCDKSMIESLARCVKWDASGGKSGSAFLKTRDDRFIAKELSRPELQTMETFAPAYFDYMLSAVCSDRPTLLAKVFGCYKLTFRKSGKDFSSSKSKVTQMNLLVMENLFYDRRFSKIYDLKGSTRNRHVQSTGKANEVLLDENLVETSHENPFYLREHSKRILRGALYNDSKFLADINVMDYSLVCGVDSDKDELVVGIVDYIRTYTWDKKVESWVKESAFLGGAGKGEPTIVTPKQYRQRFISAMERYFPLVPDRWMKNKDTPEEDPNSLSELWPDW